MSDNIIVPPCGPLDAKMCFIGEAPAKYEVEHNPPMPFVGPAGYRFDALLSQAGIFRRQCRIMNVMPTRVPGDDFKHMWMDSKMTKPTDELLEGAGQMFKDLNKLKNLQVIVALGRQPMYVLTNGKQDGISKWAGSISMIEIPTYEKSGDFSTRKVILIPTFHPSFALKQWAINPLIVHDLKRARGEVDHPSSLPKRNLIPYPDDNTIHHFFRDYIKARKNAEWYHKTVPILYPDIECYKGMITRISFATTPDLAISIPFYDYDTDTIMPDRGWLIDLIREVLATAPLVGQNFGVFDRYWLKNKWNVDCSNIVGDTMIAQHVILPGLPEAQKPLSLAMLTRLYTREPYYKDEGKIVRGKKPPPDEQQGIYNAKDAAVPCEVYQKQQQTAQFKRRKAIYDLEMNLVTGPIWYMMNRGIKIDVKRRGELRSRYAKELEWLELTVNQIINRAINLRSPTKVAILLYDEMKLKGPVSRSTDVDNLFILKAKYPDNKVLDYIGQHRRISKILDTILSAKLDTDGRFRCSYSPTTTTGRFKSFENPFGIGANLQNVVRVDNDPNIRPIFIADDGCVLVEADLEQAELRAVAYYANDERLIRLLEDDNVDIHKWMASRILTKPVNEVNYAERQLGKRIVHAGNYLISWLGLIRTCRIELGLNLNRKQAQTLLAGYFAAFPAIKRWHKQIEEQLRRNSNVLTTTFGRERKFFEHWGDELFRKATAFLPQGTIADLLNTVMQEWFDKYNDHSILAEETAPGIYKHTIPATQTTGKYISVLPGSELLLQNHDAFMTQCPEDNISNHIKSLEGVFDHPITINRHTVVIPVGIKVMKCWCGEEVHSVEMN